MLKRTPACTVLPLAFFLVAGSRLAAAAIYYVASNGSDTDNSGKTPASPFRTIQKAADLVSPGDRVVVGAGRFPGRIKITRSGSEGSPIVIEGERGSKGEWLTILDGGDAASAGTDPAPTIEWVRATEVGNHVWKTDDIPYEPWAMTVGDRTILKIHGKVMNGTSKMFPGKDGFFFLAKPPEAPERTIANGQFLKSYWDGIEAVFGWMNGTTYLRFRNGDDPNAKELYSCPGGHGGVISGAAVGIANAHHVVIRNLKIMRARVGVMIKGSAAADNVVENNVIMNGYVRVMLTGGAARNHVRNNELTPNWLGATTYPPGDWSDASYGRIVNAHVYMQDKFLAGDSAENDRCIEIDAGEPTRDNEIYNNHIHDGAVGINAFKGVANKVHDNVIHNFAAECLWIHENNFDYQIHDNLIYDGDHNIRIQSMEVGQRSLFIYRNRFYEPFPDGQSGKHIHFSFGVSEIVPPPIASATIWIYHNSFAGGGWAVDLGGGKTGTPQIPDVHIVNNIFSVRGVSSRGYDVSGKIGYNWLGGTAGVKGVNHVSRRGERMWPDSALPADFHLPDNANGQSAVDAALDLSRPFILDGGDFSELPGGRPFSGSRPDIGAYEYEPAAK